MRAKMLLDGGRPKVQPQVLKRLLVEAGMDVTDEKPDFGVVVGGDGRFSRYGRTEDVPLLFVGVRSGKAAGSKAYMARTMLDELPWVLELVKKGRFRVEKHRRLAVLKNGRQLGRVFTDVYLQRGSESTSIRYRLKVKGPGLRFEEAGIGDGVVVSTAAGSSGYYSYVDRIEGEDLDPTARAFIKEDEIGVCHIAPSYTEREGTGQHPLRYRLPWGTAVEISLFRKADARLYGTTDSKGGVRVKLGDHVRIGPSLSVTKVLVPRISAST
jgi:hypothetical protein